MGSSFNYNNMLIYVINLNIKCNLPDSSIEENESAEKVTRNKFED